MPAQNFQPYMPPPNPYMPHAKSDIPHATGGPNFENPNDDRSMNNKKEIKFYSLLSYLFY
jgi:hypothetical protein